MGVKMGQVLNFFLPDFWTNIGGYQNSCIENFKGQARTHNKEKRKFWIDRPGILW